MNDIERSFTENTTITLKNNRVQINCNKGNWGVDAPDYEQAYREAKHYFIQYYQDGEYK